MPVDLFQPVTIKRSDHGQVTDHVVALFTRQHAIIQDHLGDVASQASVGRAIASQIFMAAFCVATLVSITLLFALIFVIMAVGFFVDFLMFAPVEKRVRQRFGLEG